MIKLIQATIEKYKCIENTQSFDIEPDITVLVGMNESGKTSILEALAKANYFEKDNDFVYNLIHDYPRKQKKAIDKSGIIPDAVSLEYIIDDKLAKEIEVDIGETLSSKVFSVTVKYDGTSSWSVNWVKTASFIASRDKTLQVKNKAVLEILSSVKNGESFDEAIKSISKEVEDVDLLEQIKSLKKYFTNTTSWQSHPIDHYIMITYLSPNLPKFIYYDDYYLLPSRVKLSNISNTSNMEPATKTARALLELADVDVNKVIKPSDYEALVAELEATQSIISEELFRYWSTNTNLKIRFRPEDVADPNNRQIIEHILNIRVENTRSDVSLPLGNRSKGFNWFFSFLVWFKKIQENKANTYILLLDEPGLNLHAKAQSDLLDFLTDLAEEYQIIYTTHSPFMIESDRLNRVRTVVEKDDGTHISESVQEKDPNTLFPLQAALGYDLAQNLFVSPKNLIVEGIADLVFLNLISGILQIEGRVGLKNDITIVPVGGADKVATFVSLLRGNELDMVCLLDTFTDQSAKQRIDNLIAQHIIKDKKIVFYHDILETQHADVEDLFETTDYLSLYNGAFSKAITPDDIDKTKPLLSQLKKLNNGKDFNHYTPANYFAKNISSITLSSSTLANFEKLFAKLNKLI